MTQPMEPTRQMQMPPLSATIAFAIVSTLCSVAQCLAQPIPTFSRTQGSFDEVTMLVPEAMTLIERKVLVTFAENLMEVQGIDPKYRDRFTIPYARIAGVEYGVQKYISLGRVLTTGPVGFVMKKKKPWYTIRYNLGDGQPEITIVISVKAKVAQTFARALELSTGQRVSITAPYR